MVGGGIAGSVGGLAAAYKLGGGETIAELNLAMSYIDKFAGSEFGISLSLRDDGRLWIHATNDYWIGISIGNKAANELLKILGIDRASGDVKTWSKLIKEW